MPSTNHNIRKNSRRITLAKSSVPEMPAEAASVESRTIMIIPAMSSTINMPKTISVKRLPFIFKSSKAFIMMVVDDMESMPPKNRLFMWLQPISVPAP